MDAMFALSKQLVKYCELAVILLSNADLKPLGKRKCQSYEKYKDGLRPCPLGSKRCPILQVLTEFKGSD